MCTTPPPNFGGGGSPTTCRLKKLWSRLISPAICGRSVNFLSASWGRRLADCRRMQNFKKLNFRKKHKGRPRWFLKKSKKITLFPPLFLPKFRKKYRRGDHGKFLKIFLETSRPQSTPTLRRWYPPREIASLNIGLPKILNLGSSPRWNKLNITYSIINFSEDMSNRTFRYTMAKSYRLDGQNF